jgi:hypothetical protein
LGPGGGLLQGRYDWTYTYIVLLWLSLICKIPFDLARFDNSSNITSGSAPSNDSPKITTASRLEDIGKKHLSMAGMEGNGAALLLSNLYTR